jgi:group I intron endonuclease
MYIYNALRVHGFSVFSLSILENIDISNLFKEDARLLILEREQFYIDPLTPEYNINPTAGSRLGSKHTEGTKTKKLGKPCLVKIIQWVIIYGEQIY